MFKAARMGNDALRLSFRVESNLLSGLLSGCRLHEGGYL
jgi:hypothetical protein